MSGAAEAHTAAPAPTRVARLVDAAITRNTLAIEHAVIAELKRMCRASDEAIVALYAALMAKLGGAHPLPRLLALRVCDVFFRRSHLFRTLVVDELNEFFALTLGVVRSRPLPPPTKTAAYLRAEGVRIWRAWYELFGASDRRLHLANTFLREEHGLVMRAAEDEREAALAAANRVRDARQRIARARYSRLHLEYPSLVEECRDILTRMDNSFELLAVAWSRRDQPAESSAPPHPLQSSSTSSSSSSSLSSSSSSSLAQRSPRPRASVAHSHSLDASGAPTTGAMSSALLDELLYGVDRDEADGDDLDGDDDHDDDEFVSFARQGDTRSSIAARGASQVDAPADDIPAGVSTVMRHLMLQQGLDASLLAALNTRSITYSSQFASAAIVSNSSNSVEAQRADSDAVMLTLLHALRDDARSLERRVQPTLGEWRRTLEELDWRCAVHALDLGAGSSGGVGGNGGGGGSISSSISSENAPPALRDVDARATVQLEMLHEVLDLESRVLAHRAQFAQLTTPRTPAARLPLTSTHPSQPATAAAAPAAAPLSWATVSTSRVPVYAPHDRSAVCDSALDLENDAEPQHAEPQPHVPCKKRTRDPFDISDDDE